MIGKILLGICIIIAAVVIAKPEYADNVWSLLALIAGVAGIICIVGIIAIVIIIIAIVLIAMALD